MKKVKKQVVEEEKKGHEEEVKELFPQKYEHQRILKEAGCDLDRFIEIRHTIH